MSSPTEATKTARQQIDEAMKAIVALEEGHITVKECLSIVTYALDWLELALGSREAPTPLPTLPIFEIGNRRG